jgi:hypothetical protein
MSENTFYRLSGICGIVAIVLALPSMYIFGPGISDFVCIVTGIFAILALFLEVPPPSLRRTLTARKNFAARLCSLWLSLSPRILPLPARHGPRAVVTARARAQNKIFLIVAMVGGIIAAMCLWFLMGATVFASALCAASDSELQAACIREHDDRTHDGRPCDRTIDGHECAIGYDVTCCFGCTTFDACTDNGCEWVLAPAPAPAMADAPAPAPGMAAPAPAPAMAAPACQRGVSNRLTNVGNHYNNHGCSSDGIGSKFPRVISESKYRYGDGVGGSHYCEYKGIASFLVFLHLGVVIAISVGGGCVVCCGKGPDDDDDDGGDKSDE